MGWEAVEPLEDDRDERLWRARRRAEIRRVGGLGSRDRFSLWYSEISEVEGCSQRGGISLRDWEIVGSRQAGRQRQWKRRFRLLCHADTLVADAGVVPWRLSWTKGSHRATLCGGIREAAERQTTQDTKGGVVPSQWCTPDCFRRTHDMCNS